MEFKKLVKGFEAIDESGKKIGQVDFTINDDLMRITHTHVDSDNKGKGVAKELVKTAADYARHKNLKVKPLCSVAAYILKSEEFKDIIE